MDASIDRHMDGWIHDRRKHWGCSLNLLVSISDSSIYHCCCPSWPTLCGLSPLAQDFKLTWMLMKWYRDCIVKVKQAPDHSPGCNSPRKSQAFAHSWKPAIVPHDEDCKTHLAPTHLTGPSPGFSKGLCQLFSLIVTHWAQCQAHSRYTMKVYWTEMKFPTVPCCM